MICAVIDSTGTIVNRVELEQGSDWTPPEDCSTVEETDTSLEIGGTCIDGVYTPPTHVEPPPPEPIPPPPEDVVLFDHENRLRVIEGEPPLTLTDFLKKRK